MRKYNLCPLVALALGCGGAALRMWQQSRYADGFPPTGDLSSLLLIALCKPVRESFGKRFFL